MHADKIRNILKLDTISRYEYSLREFVKLGQVWGVAMPDSWVMFTDKDGDEVFPIWPHREVAEICMLDELKVDGHQIRAIEYDKFLKYCVPDMDEQGVLFGVFYSMEREALVVTPEQLKSDLNLEFEGA